MVEKPQICYNLKLTLLNYFNNIKNKFHKQDNMDDCQTFEFIDIKTNKLIEHTCNPDELCSDFEENDLPYYFNQVFFNKEVFSKYKMDREKYEVTSDYIIGDEWDLRYYTTDDGEQIIVQLRDLYFIPYKEQIYWKSFNEPPSSKMSHRTFTNYVLGKWAETDDITHLINTLRSFPKCNINEEELTIWEEPLIENQHNLDNLDYVKINSKTEWEDEIQTLHLNIVDGFNKSTIKLISRKMDCYDNHGSLKLMANCLENLKDIPSHEVEQIMSPLFKLNYYRSKVISHTTGEKYPKENLQDNFKRLIANLSISISFLSNIVRAGFFDFDEN